MSDATVLEPEVTTPVAFTKPKRKKYESERYIRKPVVNPFRDSEREFLRKSIIDLRLTLHEAAVKYGLDEGRIERLIFARKPTAVQIQKAMKFYDRGLSMHVACVAAGVSYEHFKEARREHLEKNPRVITRW